MSGSRPRPDAYTLLEIMLVVSLFAILCGGVFSVVQGSLGSIAAVKDTAHGRAEMDALLVALRQACAQLPATATVHAEVLPGADGIQELQFRQAPGVIQWGARWQDPAEVTVALAARRRRTGAGNSSFANSIPLPPIRPKPSLCRGCRWPADWRRSSGPSSTPRPVPGNGNGRILSAAPAPQR